MWIAFINQNIFDDCTTEHGHLRNQNYTIKANKYSTIISIPWSLTLLKWSQTPLLPLTKSYIEKHDVLTRTLSIPHCSLQSAMSGLMALSRVVWPHVFRINRFLDTNMLLSLKTKDHLGQSERKPSKQAKAKSMCIECNWDQTILHGYVSLL